MEADGGSGLPPMRRQRPSADLTRTERSIFSVVWKSLHDKTMLDRLHWQLLVTVTFHSGFPWISLPLLTCPMFRLSKVLQSFRFWHDPAIQTKSIWAFGITQT
ncbi:hypothetical protein U1Q18_018618 [Sarracenia purpurea var. burkii]